MLSKLKIFVSAFRYVVWSVFISSIPSYRFRNWYLRRVLRFQVAPSAAIHVGCWVTGFRFCVGAHSVINRNCRLDARGGITIGNNVSISPECYLISASHDPHSPSFSGTVKSNAVIIHDYA